MRIAPLALVGIAVLRGPAPPADPEGRPVRIAAVEIGHSSYNGPGPVFRKGHPARFQVTVENSSDVPASGTLDAEAIASLDTTFALASSRLELPPRSRRAFTLSWDYPGPATHEGPDGRAVRVPGPSWGLSLNVAWRDREGRERDRRRLVFAIDRPAEGTTGLAELAAEKGPGREFALRYSGYLSNSRIGDAGLPDDFRMDLSAGKVERWRRGQGPAGVDTVLASLSRCTEPASAVLEHRTGSARLSRAWLLEPDRVGDQVATRLGHLSDQKTFRFRVPPVPTGGVLVLEIAPSHHVPPVPLQELAAEAEAKFGVFPDPLLDPAGEPIRNHEDWQAQRTRMTRAIRAALAQDRDDPPCPLDPRTISEEVVPPRLGPTGWTGSYVRRKVSFEVRPGERINAWLLVSPGLGPFPAVLACHQTVSEGKDEPVGLGGNVWQLEFGPHLVSRGLVVVAVDSPAFGERFDPLTETPQDTTKDEAADPSFSLLGRRFADHARTLDYLETLTFVDRGRIGVIGHSLGGEGAAVVTALDPRIRCAVISCGFTLLRTLEKARETYCLKGHAILPAHFGPLLDAPVGKRQLPFDFDDLMRLWTPRPVFYHEVRDELPQFTSALQTLQAAHALRQVYSFLQAEERYYPVVSAQSHCFPAWVQADAFDWLSYWLSR